MNTDVVEPTVECVLLAFPNEGAGDACGQRDDGSQARTFDFVGY